jgi:tetraacyldisaccharide 4'-kinase
MGAVLGPIGALYDPAGQLRSALTKARRLPRPVICAGNLTAGGAGKTPTAIAIARWFLARGKVLHFLTRGYRAIAAGPLRVDPNRHDFRDVGDEALLLAAVAPTWIGGNRLASGLAACNAGADLLVMDDGLQNPTLAKDLSLVVVDGGYGIGNGRVFPAGPLRETVAHGLTRADAAVMIGADATGLAPVIEKCLPVLEARLVPDPTTRALAGKRVLAFAGIGRPAKFFATLEGLGATLVKCCTFDDHHAYHPDEIMRLVEEADALGAQLVTTEKDFVRFPSQARPMVTAVPVHLEWCDEAALERLFRAFLETHGPNTHG